MFYSHEILTSRKHGVATIWLVATLGSKSSLKKVSKKAILNVDVAKACETISDPDSPMALRLQSSLLYGVSRVFAQQCGYIFTDIQSLYDNMRGIQLVIRDLQIDTEVAQTSSEQLNLPSDPGFLFDFNMGLDLSAFETLSEQTEGSSLLSPHSPASSQSSLLPGEESEHQLDLSYAGTPADDFLNFDLDAGIASSSIRRPGIFTESVLDEPGIDENPLFDIDEDGGIIDRPSTGDIIGTAAGDIPMVNIDNDAEIEARVADEHAALADRQGATGMFDADDSLVLMGDSDGNLNDQSLPTPSLHPSIYVDTEQNVRNSTSADVVAESELNEEIFDAPQRRVRTAKPPQADSVTELNNRQLSEWQANYLENMARARSEQIGKQEVAQARRNAAFWVLDQGIVGAATNFGDDRGPHPLSVFSGQYLLEALAEQQSTSSGTKRPYGLVDHDTDDEEGDVRKIRSATEDNVGRGGNQADPMDVDDGTLIQGDDEEVESQVGRHLASSLKDHPSSMPWNVMSSSRQGSMRGSVQLGRSSSMRGLGFEMGPPSVISGRRSRITSASPLIGRGKLPSRLGSLDPQAEDLSFNMDEYGDPYAGLTSELDENFELYGPAGGVSSQQAAQSQWLNAALENEAQNFLIFLHEQLSKNASNDEDEPTITFEQLLPPQGNSNIVAAQGILHVLALATKGMVIVQQEEAFGNISLSISKRRDGNAENIEEEGHPEEEIVEKEEAGGDQEVADNDEEDEDIDDL